MKYFCLFYKNLGWVGIGLFTNNIGIENQRYGGIDAWRDGNGKNKNKEIDYLKIFLRSFLKILTSKGFSLRRVGISFFL